MADPVAPEKLEQLNRTEHTSTSGIEITRTFYCEPYESFRFVQQQLQGTVTVDKDDAEKWVRTSPMRDSYTVNAYCTETLVNFADEEAMASAPGLSDEARDTIIKQLQDAKEKLQGGVAGAIIKATYRPLITAWESSNPEDPEDNRWDWIDPIIQPGVRQLPWPEGLFAAVDEIIFDDGNVSVPDSVATPIGLPVHQFSIRRLLVGEVPWDAIEQAAQSVNITTFPGGKSEKAKPNLPTFEPFTLRFDGAEVQNMMDVDGKRWYELKYNFSWISFNSDRLFDRSGKQKQGPVTWNHVYFNPGANAGGIIGWYEVFQGTQHNTFLMRQLARFLPGLQLTGGRLYNATDFNDLFLLNP